MSSSIKGGHPAGTALDEPPSGAKEELNLRRLARPLGETDERMLVIIKVDEPGYIPAHIKPRTRAGRQIFTAEVNGRMLEALHRDPKVVGISAGRRLFSY